MAVMFTTYDPQGLLEAFRAAVSQREPKGKIVTWECHPDGRHYTHSAIQWRFKAFMMPAARDGSLVFNIIRNKNFEVSTTAYGFFHGHLVETFLNHFDSLFEQATASSFPSDGDRCG